MEPMTRALRAEKQRRFTVALALLLNLVIMPTISQAYCVFNHGPNPVTFYQLPITTGSFKAALRPGHSKDGAGICCNWQECDCNQCNGRCQMTMFAYKFKYDNVDAVTRKLVFEKIFSIILDVVSLVTMFIPGVQALGMALRGTTIAIRLATTAARAGSVLRAAGLARAAKLMKPAEWAKYLKRADKALDLANKADDTLNKLLAQGYDGVVTTYNGGIVSYNRDYKGKFRVMGCWGIGGPAVCLDDDISYDGSCGPQAVGSGQAYNSDWSGINRFKNKWQTSDRSIPNGCPTTRGTCPAPVCDDGVCSRGETCESCPQDCTCPPRPPGPAAAPPPPPPDTDSIIPYGLGYFASGCPYKALANESYYSIAGAHQTVWGDFSNLGERHGAVSLKWNTEPILYTEQSVDTAFGKETTVKLCGTDPLRLFCMAIRPDIVSPDAIDWPEGWSFRTIYNWLDDKFTTYLNETGYNSNDYSIEIIASKNGLFLGSNVNLNPDGSFAPIDESESGADFDKPFPAGGPDLTWCWPWKGNPKPNEWTAKFNMPAAPLSDYGSAGSCFIVPGSGQDLSDVMRLYQMSRQRLQALNPWLDPKSNAIPNYGVLTCSYQD